MNPTIQNISAFQEAQARHMIPFTQFLRPNGRQVQMYAPAGSEESLQKAYKLIEAGFNFTAEHLTTGQVAVYIGLNDGDVAMEVINNGPEVTQAIDKMIDQVYATLPGSVGGA